MRWDAVDECWSWHKVHRGEDCASDAFTDISVINVTQSGCHAQPAHTVELHGVTAPPHSQRREDRGKEWAASVPSRGQTVNMSADVNGFDVCNKAKRTKEWPKLANKMRKIKIQKRSNNEQGQAETSNHLPPSQYSVWQREYRTCEHNTQTHRYNSCRYSQRNSHSKAKNTTTIYHEHKIKGTGHTGFESSSSAPHSCNSAQH